MKKLTLLASGTFSALALFAAPHIDRDVVTFSQDVTRRVTLNYTLQDEPGIVTACIETNAADDVWVPIGDEYAANMVGDVNKVVDTGARTISWRPEKTWPGQLIQGGKIRAHLTAWATNAPPQFMVVDLTVPKSVRFYTSKAAFPGGFGSDVYKTSKLLMRKIPAAGAEGGVGMTAPEANLTSSPANALIKYPRRMVSFSSDYYMAVYETTQAQYSNIWVNAGVSGWAGGASPTTESGIQIGVIDPLCPVGSVYYVALRGSLDSYNWPNTTPLHAVADNSVIGKLRTYSGVEFDLPTEAQWEFACRAGTFTPYSAAGTDSTLIGWTSDNGGTMHRVGLLMSNDWDLHDMLGNVQEFCLDYYRDIPSSASAGLDAAGPTTGFEDNQESTERVTKGGCFAWGAGDLVQSGSRYRSAGDNTGESNRFNGGGFRLAASAAIFAW